MDANEEAGKTAGAAENCRSRAPWSLHGKFSYSSGTFRCSLVADHSQEELLRLICWPAPSGTLWEWSTPGHRGSQEAVEAYPREAVEERLQIAAIDPLTAVVVAQQVEALFAGCQEQLDQFRYGAGWLQPKQDLLNGYCETISGELLR